MTKPELKSLKHEKLSENIDDAPPTKGKETVGVLEMFRFADTKDKLYLFLAIICSVISGMGFPMSSVLFGKTVGVFINDINMGDLLDDIPAFLKNSNWSRSDVLKDPTLLRDKCASLDLYYGYNTTCSTMDLDDPISDDLGKYIYLFVILGATIFVASMGQLMFWSVSAERQGNRIRREFLTNVLRQDIGWFDVNDGGELNSKLSAEVDQIKNGIGEKAGTVIQYLTTLVAGYVIGFVKGPELAAVLVAMSPLMIGAGVLFSIVAIKMTNRELAAYSKAGSIAVEVLSSIRTVCAFGGEEKETERYDRHLGEAQKYGRYKGMANGLSIGLYTLVNFSTYAIGMWYGGKLIRDGDMDSDDVIMVFFCVSLGTFSLGIAAPGLQAISEARGAAYNVFKLIDLQSNIDSSSEKGLRPISVTGMVRFRDVHFTYPSRLNTPILKGINLDVRPGQTVALVGSSGCGKSTLVQLLLRFYDPLNGQVLLDGHNVKDLNIKWLRQNIGLVSQEPILFATSIAENIRYGKESASMDEIIQAAINANAYDFISKFPDQFNTIVGERGAQLSGGQKQRIAIARALVRDPKILLLDEATSALDTESEAIVQDALNKARLGRTTIVIAHRLSTIRTADTIICLDKGVVKEKGTHDTLMLKRGIYYTLVMNQTKTEEESDTFYDTESDMRKTTLNTWVDNTERKKLMGSTKEQEDDQEWEENLPDVTFLELLRLNSSKWLYLLLGSLAAVLHGSSQPLFAYVFSDILSVFAEDDEEMKDDLRKNAFLLFGIGVGTLIGAFIQGWMLAIAGEALTRRLRKDTFKAMLRQEIGWYDKPMNSTGALSTRLAQDSSLVQGATGTRMGIIIQCLMAIMAAVTLAFIYGWQLTLVALSFFPFLLFGGIVQMRVMSGNMGVAKEALVNAGKVAVETIENVRTVASLAKEEEFINSYMVHFNALLSNAHKRALVMGVFFAFSTSMNHFSVAGVFAFGAYLVEEDKMDPEDVLRVLIFIVFCGIYLGQSAAFGPDLGKAKAAAKRIMSILNRQTQINAELTSGFKLDKGTFQSTIEFMKTKFSYPLRPDVKVLQNLTFRVDQGQTVALVGGSGCGKSTCVGLLERFYSTDGGSVIVGNQNLEDINIRWLRAQIGLVSQEPVLFDCSVADNIAYGDNSRRVTKEEIIRAAKEANVHNFVSALPLGYDTNVGEKGTQLSGGQKQRIAIARALIRDPKILLLDEATSALDTESEKIVQEALDKARAGRTCIVIAHRLSTIHDADKIVVIHQGEAVEQGRHEELMAAKGFYYRLQNAQSKA